MTKGIVFNKPNKLKMAMKKPTKSDIKAGRVFRCGNCDALCTDDYSSSSLRYVMGRPQTESTTYYCDLACGRKHCRDKQRPELEAKLNVQKQQEQVLKELLQCYIHDSDFKKNKSKTLFQAIKMVRQSIKSITMLLSGESTLDIMKVEFFKFSEAAMDLAELVAEEEDPEFNGWAKEFPSMHPFREYDVQSKAMWARAKAIDKDQELSLWFN